MKRSDAEIIKDIQRIECSLSPENLHQDGERSRTEAARIGAQLRKQRKELVKELGREPTGQELYGR